MRAWIFLGLGMCTVGLLACASPEVKDDGSGGSNASSGSGSGPSTGAGNNSGTGSSTGAGGDTGTGTTSSTGSGTTTGGGGTCGSMATWDDCEVCECDKNEAGCDSYWSLEDEHCYCGAGAPCLQQCTVYCGNDDDALDPTCDACDDGLDDTCFEAARAACDGDAACSAYAQALEQSCDALP